jgi:hypothetical protein
VHRACIAPGKAYIAPKKACIGNVRPSCPAYRRCTRGTRVHRQSPGPGSGTFHDGCASRPSAANRPVRVADNSKRGTSKYEA